MTGKHMKTYKCRRCGYTVKSDRRPESCYSCGGEFYDEFTSAGIRTYAIMKESKPLDSVKNLIQEIGWRFEMIRERIAAGNFLSRRKSSRNAGSKKIVMDAANYHGYPLHESAHWNPKLHEADHNCNTDACKYCSYAGVCMF